MQRLKPIFLSSIATGIVLFSTAGAWAQTATRGLRTGTPTTIAQPVVPTGQAPDAGAASGDLPDLPGRAGSQSAISRSQPPRAAKPVQNRRVRAVTQRPVRAEPLSVSRLPVEADSVVAVRRRRAADEDPYAPLGLRLGNVVVTPSVTNGIGYDTNPERTSSARRDGSAFSRHEGEIGVQSDWNVHELKGTLKGGYSNYFRNENASRPDATGNLDLRLDASRDTRILLETRAALDTQRPGSPDLTASVRGRPQVYQYGAAAGVTQDFNRLQLTLRGAVDRSDYEDAQLTSGAILSQKDRNQTQYGLRLRAAYEITPGFKPFIQGDVDTRQFDQSVDTAGYRRSSDGVGGRVGSSFEFTRQLTGEVSVGYQDRNYDDARLKNLRGIVGDAAILWSPTPLTTVTLRGSSELGDTTIPGSSGTTSRRAVIEIAHALRRNVIVTGFFNASRTDYDGQALRENLSSVGARLEYKLTRTFSVRASFTHEWLKSTAVGADYTANVGQVGLRVQF